MILTESTTHGGDSELSLICVEQHVEQPSTKGPHGGPRENARPWTTEEDELLVAHYRKHGPLWELITLKINEDFPNPNPRTHASTRNRFLRMQSGLKERHTGRYKNTRDRPNLCTKCRLPKKGHTCRGSAKIDSPVFPVQPKVPNFTWTFNDTPFVQNNAPVDLICKESIGDSTEPEGDSTEPEDNSTEPEISSTAQARQSLMDDSLNALCDSFLEISNQSEDEYIQLFDYLPHILALLKLGPLWRRAKAANVVTNMMRSEENKILLVEAGVVPLLVALLNPMGVPNPGFRATKLATCGLRTLAFASETRGQCIEQANAIPLLVALSASKNLDTEAMETITFAKEALVALKTTSLARSTRIDEAIAWSTPEDKAAIIALSKLD